MKSPKIYWRDSGLVHQLLGIGDATSLLAHPRCGASWEGFVLESLHAALAPDESYFWATHTGAELDALFVRAGRRLGVEIKRADAPRLTPSMRHAMTDLNLDLLWIVYPGSHAYAPALTARAARLRFHANPGIQTETNMSNMEITFFRVLREAKVTDDMAQAAVESLEEHIAEEAAEAAKEKSGDGK